MESQEGELGNLLISCHDSIVITDNYDLIPSSRKSCRSLTSKWQKVLVTQYTMNEPQNGRHFVGPARGLMLDQTSGKQILVTDQLRVYFGRS